jgi:hypothetical protein
LLRCYHRSAISPRPPTLQPSTRDKCKRYCRVSLPEVVVDPTYASTTRSYTFSLGSLPGRVLSLATRSADSALFHRRPWVRPLTARIVVRFGVRVHVRGGVSVRGPGSGSAVSLRVGVTGWGHDELWSGVRCRWTIYVDMYSYIAVVAASHFTHSWSTGSIRYSLLAPPETQSQSQSG